MINQNLNNVYNFKNSIRFFINIDQMKYPDDISEFNIGKLSWSKPFKFRIKKEHDKYRTLKIPNILNFVASYNYYCYKINDFEDIKSISDPHKRLSANIQTGDFISGEYDKQLEGDFSNLCIYDNLIKLDIKEYYGRIYTHYVIPNNETTDLYLSNLNSGATNGLLMGNYISLYFAEKELSIISDSLETLIRENDINCNFSYFSDDFYFFCNKADNNTIIKIFDQVLEKHNLERNEHKKEFLSYESFNKINLVARYWKKLIATCNQKYDDKSESNKLIFINLLIYNIDKLSNEKLKTSFLINFFKTKYFRNLNLNKFILKSYDYHQLCFLMNFAPEIMLFSIDKFEAMTSFNKDKLKEFFRIRFFESLKKQFNEEQLYYYYSIKIFKFEDILISQKEKVLKSDNQLLISYYLKDNIFDEKDINELRFETSEEYWFQNYHLILYCEDLLSDINNSIIKYLVPAKCKPKTLDGTFKNNTQSYIDFYKSNLESKIPIINDIPIVKDKISSYLELKHDEYDKNYDPSYYD